MNLCNGEDTTYFQWTTNTEERTVKGCTRNIKILIKRGIECSKLDLVAEKKKSYPISNLFFFSSSVTFEYVTLLLTDHIFFGKVGVHYFLNTDRVLISHLQRDLHCSCPPLTAVDLHCCLLFFFSHHSLGFNFRGHAK